MKHRNHDPDPWSIAASVGAIISGVAGAVYLGKTYGPVSLKRPHRRMIEILQSMVENLKGIDAATQGMQRAIASGSS